MTLKDIEALWERLEHSSVSELQLEMEGVSLSLRKCASGGQSTAQVGSPAAAYVPVNAVAPAVSSAETTAEAPKGESVNSPIVGTFYAAPAPGEKPFVSVGDCVSAGDVVGIVEAMKLMNEITTPHDGVVVAVEAEDGKMVQYGQVLVRIAPKN